MSYKPSWRVRDEGKRYFERNRFGAYDNPYPEYGEDYDDRRHHKDWDAGFQEARQRDEERRED